jgi:hypothetical protein
MVGGVCQGVSDKKEFFLTEKIVFSRPLTYPNHSVPFGGFLFLNYILTSTNFQHFGIASIATL